MKTKEIDVRLEPVSGFLYSLEPTYLGDDFDEKHIKAKLIIEIPEKKIEITESCFEKIILTSFDTRRDYSCTEYTKLDINLDKIKKELGF